VNERPIKELTYDTAGDTLQIWLVDGPVDSTFNRPADDDGLYAILRLVTDEPLGWEIVGFQHYASVHPQWRALADAFARLPGGALTWREPALDAGLELLLHQ